MSILIPDTSEWQTGPSAPDWAGIKKQNGGAGIVRVGYGLDHLDKMFVKNYTALKANKFSFSGLYHYLVAGQDAAAQANQFCTWVGPPSAVAPGTVFICDLEEGAGDQSGRALSWLTIVDSFYGLDAVTLNRRSWLYSYTSFAAAHNLNGIFSSARRTWIAAYQPTEPVIGHTLWQSTDGTNGSHITAWPGCGRCDTSYYPGSLATLAATGWQSPVTPPVPPAQPQKDDDMMIPASAKTHAVSFASGAYNWISFFCDNSAEGAPSQQIRVAPWSADGGGGFAGITNISVDVDHEKVTVQLPAHCAGISLQRPGTDPGGTLWVPVAYNMG